MKTNESPTRDQGTPAPDMEEKKATPKTNGNLVAIVIALLVLGVGVILYIQEDGATAQVSQANKNNGTLSLLSNAADNPENTANTASSGSVQASGLKVGDQAPTFTLATEEGSSYDLAGFEGKPTLLVFEATWCTYCQREHEDVEQLRKDYGDDINVLTVYINEDPSTVAAANADRGTERLTLVDETGDVAIEYGATGTPTHVFLNSDHTVADYRPGLMTYDELNASITALN